MTARRPAWLSDGTTSPNGQLYFRLKLLLPPSLLNTGPIRCPWLSGLRVSSNDPVAPALDVTDTCRTLVFFIAIIIVNIFGTLGYAEEEFWSSCLKLTVVVMFVLIGIVINCGGGPSDGIYANYIGGRYWSNPGAFANGFKGVCSVFVTAAFSFGELD